MGDRKLFNKPIRQLDKHLKLHFEYELETDFYQNKVLFVLLLNNHNFVTVTNVNYQLS